ncbi:MAG: sigma-70 family RNA polymerase sigma factor [Lachnospiraceae bacterium]|nr:sigma-70 family RNA polymerase sigma factor [Lachnospiraceae bacterium]
MTKNEFEAVYREKFSYVYNYVYMRVIHKELAEDITSQTFLNAFSHLDSFDPKKASVGTWLCRIAKNLITDHYRSSETRLTSPTEEYPETPFEDESLSTGDAINDEAKYLLEHLTPEERELIALRYGLDMKVTDIAEQYGITLKAASKRIQRILEKCRKLEVGRDNVLIAS